MAITDVTSSYCDIVEGIADTTIDKITQVKFAINAPLAALLALIATLQGEAASLAQDIEDAINQMKNNLDGLIPDLGPGLDSELLNILEKCEILEISPTESLGKIAKDLSNGLLTSVSDFLTTTVENLASLPEYPVAAAMLEINELLDNLEFPNILDYMDKALQCLDALCGRDITSQAQQIDDLLDEMYLTDNGQLDRGRMYIENGITSDQIFNVEKCYSEIKSASEDAVSKVRNTANGVANTISSLF